MLISADDHRIAPLADPAETARRRARLADPSMRGLRSLACRMREQTGLDVPDADPLDGGTEARFLLLLETPGPSIRTTGFVSRDNPTPTARNLRRFLAAAAIPRVDTLIWNAVPWVIHAPGARNRAPRPAEQVAALFWVDTLLGLLPRLRVIVLSGRIARALAPTLARARPDLPVLAMPHPSPTIVCTDPAIGRQIAGTLARAASLLAPDADHAR